MRDKIFDRFEQIDFGEISDSCRIARGIFDESRSSIQSLLDITSLTKASMFLRNKHDQVNKLLIVTKDIYIRNLMPGTFASRDSEAMIQGIKVPPHLDVLAELVVLEDAIKCCEELRKIIDEILAHSRRLITNNPNNLEGNTIGRKIFIGHGQSLIWRELKDFLQNRLGLEWEEFNRVPVAGTGTNERLIQMLNESAFAFLIMTAEDEQPDGTRRARMNVIHEVGLFQGKLGFKKAIILLEDGCEEFGNIIGLTQIRFPKGNIKSTFEEIRLVLERESIIKPD